MKKIDYICIGFPKCGTFALLHFLDKHPDINCLIQNREKKTPRNEAHFFDKNYGLGLEWYETLLMKDKINVEKTPSYVFDKSVLTRIKSHYPNVKIIVNIRNPIDYLESFYNHRKLEFVSKFIKNPLQRSERHIALLERKFAQKMGFKRFLKSFCPETKSKQTYLQTGIFVNYIKDVLEVFDRNQVIFLSQERLQKMQYFSDVDNLEFLDLKYKKLLKELHPDMGGDSGEFQEMREQYKNIKRNLEMSA